jgi:hypothetical protein
MYKWLGLLLCYLYCMTPGVFAQDGSRKAAATAGMMTAATAGTMTATTDTAVTGSAADIDSAMTDSVMTDSAVGAVTDSVALRDTVPAAAPWYTLRKADSLLDSAHITVFRKLSPVTMTNLRKEDDFWYVPVGPDKKKKEKQKPDTPKPFEIRKWFVFLIYSLIAGLLVAVIVFLLQSGNGERWFRSSKRKLAAPEDGTKDIAPTSLEEALRTAVDQEQYAAAVRYLFLITLGRLAARNRITPGPDKTNREYLRELRENALYGDFARLVLHYEYTFYGGFTLEQDTFREIREQYEQFQNRLDAL